MAGDFGGYDADGLASVYKNGGSGESRRQLTDEDLLNSQWLNVKSRVIGNGGDRTKVGNLREQFTGALERLTQLGKSHNAKDLEEHQKLLDQTVDELGKAVGVKSKSSR